MIKSFRCADTRIFFETGRTRRWLAIASVVERKLTMLDAALELADLRSPPGNRLEPLYGDREGQYSIRINGQYRICFFWGPNGAENVEIVDYH
ncbi:MULTISPECIES: type II toxin-antitoxin system RelE/ParE family toxin [Pseudomonas]|uniref:type II toxin-antitoxin system RelE/ParE family toxin n=1 Tax=Pseudomonas TaxID=286 RepID=UPI0012978B93|nr:MULTISPECIES: type II toxin-antitoxin system RelE/ParE family toxin [Pseudomonas]MDU7557564.1 type II toxin-antitoxin system RelE/ParE family toxin [Pseudomonas sp.]MCU1755545.1 type II toxin-antitoxin system RelE/ParE family toxin [Pseudomonas helleri]MQT39630.1 proteic killer protein [Pseudomonas sp. FSL R10-0765]MQT51273.1 proteic killer protein [Pseudomonas sp. FSL R10-2398]MQT98712.1 proteic killer protein [Pseudomonas sp. FSL R10-2245]